MTRPSGAVRRGAPQAYHPTMAGSGEKRSRRQAADFFEGGCTEKRIRLYKLWNQAKNCIFLEPNTVLAIHNLILEE